MNNTACIDSAALLALLSGELDEDSAVYVEQHLEHCADCRQTLDSIKRDTDELVADLQNAEIPSFASVLANSAFLSAMDRVAGLDSTARDDARTGTNGDLRLRCPHCHTPVSIPSSSARTESHIACSSCGHSFGFLGEKVSEAPIKQVGKFSIVELIGMGSFGQVWKAIDPELDRIVAIKIPRKESLDASSAKQFLREARTAAQLRHPNVVRIHEVGQENGQVYIVSDYVDGQTLAQRIANQPLSHRAAAELCVLIAEGLQHAHENGVIHRDVKPANIMIDAKETPHIMDFGLAKREAGDMTVTWEGRILGTPAYMSPEQAKGDGNLAGPPSDIYSLGVVLFELLTGEKPFRGSVRMLLHQVINDEAPSPRALSHSVPKDLETIALKCLQKDFQDRYSSAKELADDLRRHLDGRPILARPISQVERAFRWCKRNRAVSFLSACVVVLVAGGMALLVVKNRHLAESNERVVAANLKSKERFGIALDSIEGYYTGVSKDLLLQQESLSELRRRLLYSPLKFYQRLSIDLQGEADPALRAGLARSFNAISDIHDQVGSQAEALTAAEKSVELYRQLVGEDPDNKLFQENLAGTLKDLGARHRKLGNSKLADASFREAIRRIRELADREPKKPEYGNMLVLALGDHAILLAQLAQTDDAMRAFDEMLEIANRIVRENPTVADYEHNLLLANINRGRLEQSQGMHEQALTSYQHAIEVGEQLKSRPASLRYLADLILAYDNLGILQLNIDGEGGVGTRQKAAESFRAGIKIGEHLVKELPLVARGRNVLAKCYSDLGSFHYFSGEFDEAADFFGQAIEHNERLVRDHPSVVEYYVDLAKNYNNQGSVAINQSDMESARDWLDQSIGIREELVEKFPLLKEHRVQLAGSYANRAVLEQQLSNHLSAIDWAEKTIDLLRKELSGNARDPELRSRLWRGYAVRAESRSATGDDLEAVLDWSKAIDLHAGEKLTFLRLRRALSNARGGMHASAAEEARDLAASRGATESTLYDAACVLSLCAESTRNDELVSESESEELIDEYGHEAVQLLMKASSTGYFSIVQRLESLKTGDSDLDAIRARKDFSELIASLGSENVPP